METLLISGLETNTPTIEKPSKLDFRGINCTTSNPNLPQIAQVNDIITYLASTFPGTCRCYTFRNESYTHAKTLNGVELNLWRTKANPRVLQSAFNWSVTDSHGGAVVLD